MTGLSEVRKRLERALRDANPQDRISAGAAHDILVIAISEALALMDSEQGEPITFGEVLVVDGEVVEISLDEWGEGQARVPHPQRYPKAKAIRVAILGTESENGADND